MTKNPAQPTTNILSVQGLTRRFGGIIANNNINFNVAQGSITALIGPNGAGKTTVFNCITGFYRVSSGEIHITHGNTKVEVGALLRRPFTGGSYLVARAGVARTFQNIRLFKDMTVIENLLVAQHLSVDSNLLRGMFANNNFLKRENLALDLAHHWLEIMDLSEYANRLAGELSYGRQRRLEIARSMCTSPKLICLDEPAAGLNPRETEQLSELIQTLRADHDVTVLLIEHDMGLVMDISDHIVVLDYGQVIAAGDSDTVRNSPEVIAAYLGTDTEDEQ